MKIRLSSVLTFWLIVGFYLNIPVANAAMQNAGTKSLGRIQTSLVVDGKTGKILHASNANKKIYPASLTKVMTIYLMFEALASGKLSLDQKLYVSSYAAQARPLKLNLKPKERISVKDTILALIVKSANDAARVAAENIAGSEKRFARLMTIRARQLGMKNTTFTNASGWHDPNQISTAIDLAKLSIAIKRDFPQYYHFFKTTSFKFKNKTIVGHNRVVATYPGAEGLKTGFTNPAGCNLITSATRGNKSLVAVVTGSSSSTIRNKKMVQLLDKHFGEKHNTIKVTKKTMNLSGTRVANERSTSQLNTKVR